MPPFPKAFECSFCDKCFLSHTGIISHLRNHIKHEAAFKEIAARTSIIDAEINRDLSPEDTDSDTSQEVREIKINKFEGSVTQVTEFSSVTFPELEIASSPEMEGPVDTDTFENKNLVQSEVMTSRVTKLNSETCLESEGINGFSSPEDDVQVSLFSFDKTIGAPFHETRVAEQIKETFPESENNNESSSPEIMSK